MRTASVLLSAVPLFICACVGAASGVPDGGRDAGELGGGSGGGPTGGGSTGGGSTGGGSTGGGSAGGGGSGGRTDAGYDTNFDGTQNPISEGGTWGQQGRTSGLDWTNVRTGGGIAYGTQTGNDGYDDSIALLTGFGPNQRVTAVIHLAGTRSASTSTHEVELILRGSYTPHQQRLYECNIGYAGPSGWYSQIVRQDGPIGTFTEITNSVSQTPDIRDGDVFTAEIIGEVINTYVNGVKVGTATDANIATGQPGIGFFWRGTENIEDFGFTALTATPL